VIIRGLAIAAMRFIHKVWMFHGSRFPLGVAEAGSFLHGAGGVVGCRWSRSCGRRDGSW
jgi:hypothetical protein